MRPTVACVLASLALLAFVVWDLAQSKVLADRGTLSGGEERLLTVSGLLAFLLALVLVGVVARRLMRRSG